jgi:hypothetical protein
MQIFFFSPHPDNPKIAKRLGSQIANPQIDTFAEVTQILKKARKFSDLRFGQLISGPPTFAPSKKNTSLNIVNPHL